MSGTMQHRIRFFLLPIMLVALLAAGLSFFVASTPLARAQSLDSAASTTNQAVQLDSPAVVRIVSKVDGQVTCYQCANDGSSIVSPQNGYFELDVSGSGAFISPDGYILTADHVVDHTTSNTEDDNEFLNAAANDIAQQDNLTPGNVLQILENDANQGKVSINMTVQSQQVFLSTAYTGQLQSTAQAISYPVTRVVASSPIDKQDTAIILVEEAHDMPFLNLAPNSSINVGDTVTAIGYPGDADCVVNGCDFSALLNPSQSDATTLSSLLALSSNTGQITAQKNLQDGTPVYEVGGDIAAAGSSGGPVINQQGQIIGFVDAGTSNDRLAYVIPSSVVQSYVQQTGVTNPRGNFMSLWAQALSEYNSSNPCLKSQAPATLTKLRSNYPQFGAVVPLLQNAQTGPSGACSTPGNTSSNTTLLIVVIAAILLLLGLVAFIFLKRRKRVVPSAVIMPTPAPQASSSPSQPRWPSQTQYSPYQPQGPTGYGSGAWNTGPDSQAVTMPNSQGPAAQSLTPVRQCSNGHMVYEREARFCPECGALVQEQFMRR